MVPAATAAGWQFDYPFSIEHQVFPQLVEGRNCFGFTVESEVIDIGTPERYRNAQRGLG